ncbi:MAG: hypothetical protein JSW49_10045 [candidate division WOR-3 bacterium]|nr:MAG: hypothetical protein JSW49_10045 [candidate division WOR-3 bacterium]
MLGCKGKTLCGSVIMVLIVLASTSIGYAQETPQKSSPRFHWLNIGIGTRPYDLTLGISYSIQFNQIIVGARSIYSTEVYIDLLNFGYYQSPPETHNLYDYGVLIGYSTRKPQSKWAISIAAGISGTGSDLYNTTFGVPIEAQFLLNLRANVGIGLYLFANLNKEKNFSGVIFCLQVGNLR